MRLEELFFCCRNAARFFSQILIGGAVGMLSFLHELIAKETTADTSGNNPLAPRKPHFKGDSQE